jgi:hypothetical protein
MGRYCLSRANRYPSFPPRRKTLWRSISNQTILTSSLWLRSSQSVTTPRTCSIGRVSSCAIFAARTTRKVGSANAHITNVESGKNTRGNLPNADAVDGQNTAAKSVRRAHGSSIGIGALKHSNDLRLVFIFDRSLHRHLMNQPIRPLTPEHHRPLYPLEPATLASSLLLSIDKRSGFLFDCYSYFFGSVFMILYTAYPASNRSKALYH